MLAMGVSGGEMARIQISEEHKLIPERSEIKRKMPKQEIGYNMDKQSPGN